MFVVPIPPLRKFSLFHFIRPLASLGPSLCLSFANAILILRAFPIASSSSTTVLTLSRETREERVVCVIKCYVIQNRFYSSERGLRWSFARDAKAIK